jgi:hypothetical protein
MIRDEPGRIEDARIHVRTGPRVRDRAVEDITILGWDVQTEVRDGAYRWIFRRWLGGRPKRREKAREKTV